MRGDGPRSRSQSRTLNYREAVQTNATSRQRNEDQSAAGSAEEAEDDEGDMSLEIAAVRASEQAD